MNIHDEYEQMVLSGEEDKRIKSMIGHHFKNKQAVRLKAWCINEMEFTGLYGEVFIRVMETECGKVVKYMGGTDYKIEKDGIIHEFDCFIKHTTHKGVKETLIQKLKFIE